MNCELITQMNLLLVLRLIREVNTYNRQPTANGEEMYQRHNAVDSNFTSIDIISICTQVQPESIQPSELKPDLPVLPIPAVSRD